MNSENTDVAADAGPPSLFDVVEPGEPELSLLESNSTPQAEDTGPPPEWLVETINESTGSV